MSARDDSSVYIDIFTFYYYVFVALLPRQGVVQPVHVHRVVHDAPVGHRPDGAGVGPAVLEQQCGGEALLWLLVTLCLVSHVIHGSPVRSRSLGPHPGAFANGSPPL